TVSIFSRDWELIATNDGVMVRLSPETAIGTGHDPWEYVSAGCSGGSASAALWVSGFQNYVVVYRLSGHDWRQEEWLDLGGPWPSDPTLLGPDAVVFMTELLSADTLYLQPPGRPERNWILQAPEWLRDLVLDHCA